MHCLVTPIKILTLQIFSFNILLRTNFTNFYMFITLRPLLMLYVYKSYLTPPSPTNSVYLSTLWLYFPPLATKTPCLRKFQHIHTKHNNTHPPTFHARSSFKPFRLILFITFYLLRNLLLTIPLLFPPPLIFDFFRYLRTIYQFIPISCLFLRRRSGWTNPAPIFIVKHIKSPKT